MTSSTLVASAMQPDAAADGDDIGLLVVDDQASFRAAITALVEMTEGVELVGTAIDSRSAMAALAAARPDLVLLDINLGRESGIELARALVDAQPSVRVVLMSTYAEADLAAAASRCGAERYIHKAALTPTTLVEIVTTTDPGWIE